MFVSGPVGTSVTGSSEARTMSAMKSTACRESGFVVGAGNAGPSIPLLPCTYSAMNGSRTMGTAAPAATGISVRPVNSSSFSALTVVFSSVWLPWTVVTPTSSTSGLPSASSSAIASSWPGSQSSRMRVAQAYLELAVLVRALDGLAASVRFETAVDRSSLWAGLFDLRENLFARALDDLRALAAA